MTSLDLQKRKLRLVKFKWIIQWHITCKQQRAETQNCVFRWIPRFKPQGPIISQAFNIPANIRNWNKWPQFFSGWVLCVGGETCSDRLLGRGGVGGWVVVRSDSPQEPLCSYSSHSHSVVTHTVLLFQDTMCWSLWLWIQRVWSDCGGTRLLPWIPKFTPSFPKWISQFLVSPKAFESVLNLGVWQMAWSLPRSVYSHFTTPCFLYTADSPIRQSSQTDTLGKSFKGKKKKAHFGRVHIWWSSNRAYRGKRSKSIKNIPKHFSASFIFPLLVSH